MATSFQKSLAFATLNIRSFSDRKGQYQHYCLLIKLGTDEGEKTRISSADGRKKRSCADAGDSIGL